MILLARVSPHVVPSPSIPYESKGIRHHATTRYMHDAKGKV